ncbi:MAG: hypothetical protein IT427_12460 [Pirellulales bacterium]|nr:hypothetical protein [Pirellulales bacterium]
MPATETSPNTEPVRSECPPSVRATRFDPPHEIPRAEEDAAVLREAAALPVAAPTELPLAVLTTDSILDAENVSSTLVRQFRTQAQQLAGHLESRQRDLDHREAELHSQLARHEAAARSARLWFQEQHGRLTRRQAEWERREQEISLRLQSLGRSAALYSEETSAAGMQRSPSAIDDEIDFRLRQSEFHERSAQLEARHHHCEAIEKQLAIRHQHLEAAEARISHSEVELQFARQELLAEREAHAARLEHQRRQLDEDRARQTAELVQRRSELDEQESQFEKRAAAIEQLHNELLLTQRDSLESQLATQELRAELAGQVPPAIIVQSLARLRAKLSEHYRLQSEGVERQRSELAARTATAAKQHRQIAARQREFENWMAAQHRQIEEQAAQLAGREMQQQRAQNELASYRLNCESQRRELEAEIRGLQAYIRRLEDNAAELS